MELNENQHPKGQISSKIKVHLSTNKGRILLVDLNNEASYPTLAIGCLKEPLIADGYDVDVFSPLAHGMKPLPRDQQETFIDYAISRLLFSASPTVEWAKEVLISIYNKIRFRPTLKLKRTYRSLLTQGQYDGVMVSCYLQYYPMMVSIAAETKRHGIPLLLGGPYFNQQEVTKEWLKIDGVDYIFGGEADYVMPQLAKALIKKSGLESIKGVFHLNGELAGQAAPPIAIHNSKSMPDFDHFSWSDHPHRVIPIMAGRGCAWGKCLFCSDVTTASTRTFRSRRVQLVLAEMKFQSQRYKTNNYIFFDSKLNSDLFMWRGLISHIQTEIPGANWVASVHIDGKGENGLSAEELELAFSAGLRRVSFGLETASQRLNKKMLKGTSVPRTREFVKNAHAAGISVRTTIMLGYPGETAKDVLATADFLRDLFDQIDRVKLSGFKAIPGTAFESRLERRPEKFKSIKNFRWDYRFAKGIYNYHVEDKKQYRRAKADLLKIVHLINKKAIMDSAQQFNGLM